MSSSVLALPNEQAPRIAELRNAVESALEGKAEVEKLREQVQNVE